MMNGFSILFTKGAVWIWYVPYLIKKMVICVEDVI